MFTSPSCTVDSFLESAAFRMRFTAAIVALAAVMALAVCGDKPSPSATAPSTAILESAESQAVTSEATPSATADTPSAVMPTPTETPAATPEATPAPEVKPAQTFTSISAGGGHTCGVITDGSAACQGNNDWGQSTPHFGEFASISAGGGHTCGVQADGSISCWGDNEWGQSTPPAGAFASISSGDYHTCALNNSGAVFCWGLDQWGQSTPPSGEFVSVSAGGAHTCGVRTSGAAVCWGYYARFQSTPLPGAFTAVSAGGSDACGVKTDGSMACWGYRDVTWGWARPVLTRVPTGEFTSVSTGPGFACGLRPDSSVTCWGNDGNGQSTPPPGSFVSVSAGQFHACGLRADGSVSCWGEETGEPWLVYRIDTEEPRTCSAKTDGSKLCRSGNHWDPSTPPSGEFVSVSAGRYHTCGVMIDSSVACWGNDEFSQSTPPQELFASVSAGDFHTCGVKTDGSLACWGYDEWNWTTPPPGVFASVSAGGYTCGVTADSSASCWGEGRSAPPPGEFASLSTGFTHACGVRTDGTVACWGYNQDERASPPSGDFVSVSAGRYHTCGVRANASVACWGEDADGQSSSQPGEFISVSAGHSHTCGVSTDGSVACWGEGWSMLPSGEFTHVSAGRHHTCGLKTDRSVACWGRDSHAGMAPDDEAPDLPHQLDSALTNQINWQPTPIPLQVSEMLWTRVRITDPERYPPIRDGVLRVRGTDVSCFDADKTECHWLGHSTHFDTLTHWYRNPDEPLSAEDYRPLPELAESWEVTSPTSVTFRLRKGVRFHDMPPLFGREMTADDVKYSFERSLRPGSRWAALLGPVSEINTLNDYEIEFRFDTPYPPFMARISHAIGYPIRAREVEEEFGGLDSFGAMIGTGQYMIDEYEVGTKQRFLRNEQYFRGPNGVTGQGLPYIASFNVLTIPDEQVAGAAYRSGLLDHGRIGGADSREWGFLWALDQDNDELRDRLDLVYQRYNTRSGGYANYSYSPRIEGIWENRKLRWAVAMYNDISCAVWCRVTGGIQDTRLVAADSPWFLPNDVLAPDGQQFYEYFPEPTMSLAKAKQYVMEAKRELGLPTDESIKTTFTVNRSDHGLEEIAMIYIANLSKIGIEAELISLDPIEFIRVREGNFTGLTMWYNGGWLDIGEFFYNRYHSKSVNNFIGVSDPHLDDLIMQGQSVYDPEERLPIFYEIQEYLADAQYDFAVPNESVNSVFPIWVHNPRPALEHNVGDMWLEAWIDMSHPSRNSHDWEPHRR